MDISDILMNSTSQAAAVEMAVSNRQVWQANVDAGFTPDQATYLLGQMINGTMMGMVSTQVMLAANEGAEEEDEPDGY